MLTYTKNEPTVPGWYWYKKPSWLHAGEIVQIFESKDEELFLYNYPSGVVETISLGAFLINHNYNLLWAGPVPSPVKRIDQPLADYVALHNLEFVNFYISQAHLIPMSSTIHTRDLNCRCIPVVEVFDNVEIIKHNKY